MTAKTWTTKEISYIQKNALFAETNEILNVAELAKKLSRSSKSVETKTYNMLKDGLLPEIDRTKAFDSTNRPFTPKEDKRLIAMVKQGSSYVEIGEVLGRNERSISGRLSRLRKKGKLKYYSKSHWSEKQIQLVIENVKFDENGFVSNYAELAQLVNKQFSQIQQKVSRLRKEGVITVQADRTKTSVKSKVAMNKFNEARFAQYQKEEKPVLEEKAAQTDVKIETQSKMVQVIMTTTIAGKERTTSFFTSEGELLTVKKEAI